MDCRTRSTPWSENRKGAETFTIATPEGPLVIKNLRDFVTVRGGGYFFMPGKRVLQYLARASGEPAAVGV
jgi:hypothetical protein